MNTTQHETNQTEQTKPAHITEAIKYRKRAQSAEQQLESTKQQLTDLTDHNAQLTDQLKTLELEKSLADTLRSAHIRDLEAGILLVKERLDDSTEIDDAVEQLKGEKPYLFHSTEQTHPIQTRGLKQSAQAGSRLLECSAKQAAATGSRTDLQRYMQLRRQYV